jgi:hypothetical protein
VTHTHVCVYIYICVCVCVCIYIYIYIYIYICTGPEEKCAEKEMHAGLHEMTITGFQHGGGAYMDFTYE